MREGVRNRKRENVRDRVGTSNLFGKDRQMYKEVGWFDGPLGDLRWIEGDKKKEKIDRQTDRRTD